MGQSCTNYYSPIVVMHVAGNLFSLCEVLLVEGLKIFLLVCDCCLINIIYRYSSMVNRLDHLVYNNECACLPSHLCKSQNQFAQPRNLGLSFQSLCNIWMHLYFPSLRLCWTHYQSEIIITNGDKKFENVWYLINSKIAPTF